MSYYSRCSFMASVGCDSRMGKHIGKVADTWESMWVPCTRLLCAVLCCAVLSCHFVSFPVPSTPDFSLPTMSRLLFYLLFPPFGLTYIPCGCRSYDLAQSKTACTHCLSYAKYIFNSLIDQSSLINPHTHHTTPHYTTHYPTGPTLQELSWRKWASGQMSVEKSQSVS